MDEVLGHLADALGTFPAERHGRPGLGTWWWSALVAAGGVVEVGRLQVQLHRQPVALAAGRSPDGAHAPAVPGRESSAG